MCFLNPKAYPIGNLSLAMVSRKKARFFLGITHGAIGIIVSLDFVAYGASTINIDRYLRLENYVALSWCFFTKYCFQDVNGQILFTMHNIKHVMYH